MNFDFLEGLRGLGYVYENCNNAEKLAMTMPVQKDRLEDTQLSLPVLAFVQT